MMMMMMMMMNGKIYIKISGVQVLKSVQKKTSLIENFFFVSVMSLMRKSCILSVSIIVNPIIEYGERTMNDEARRWETKNGRERERERIYLSSIWLLTMLRFQWWFGLLVAFKNVVPYRWYRYLECSIIQWIFGTGQTNVPEKKTIFFQQPPEGCFC